MIKVYEKGVNVCISGHADYPNEHHIPTHQTRFELKADSIVITDLFPFKNDRIVILKTELQNETGQTFSTDTEISNYLSEFIGKSYCCSESSVLEPLNQFFENNSLPAGRNVVIDYKTLANVDVKRQTITYDGSDNLISNIFTLPPYGVVI